MSQLAKYSTCYTLKTLTHFHPFFTPFSLKSIQNHPPFCPNSIPIQLQFHSFSPSIPSASSFHRNLSLHTAPR